MATLEIKVPDIGDFAEVSVIEVLAVSYTHLTLPTSDLV